MAINSKSIDYFEKMTINGKMYRLQQPLTHNSVQSHNSVHFTLFARLAALIKDSGSLHSAKAVKTEKCEKTGF